MRRLARHLFTLLAALSLLLCVATCVLWAGSYQRRNSIVHVSLKDGAGELYSWRGWIRRGPDLRPYDRQLEEWQRAIRQAALAELEKHLAGDQSPPTPRPPTPLQPTPPAYFELRLIPYAGVAAAAAVLPAIEILRLAIQTLRLRGRRRRSLDRLCPACGYDLRASPKRCPECGAVPATMDKG